MYNRRIRKLQSKLDDLNARITVIQNTNYWPEHAPTTCRIQRQESAPLLAQRRKLLNQLENASMRTEWD